MNWLRFTLAKPIGASKTLAKSWEQYSIPVDGQADILITGIPYISPYNVNSKRSIRCSCR